MSRRRGQLPEPPFRQLGDPLYSQRNPYQFFLLTLSVISGFTLLEGTTGSEVLDAALNDAAVTVWGASLLLGSLTALVGMWWPKTWTGLIIERAGLGVVAAAALIYSWLLYEAATEARYSGAVHLAFGLACFWRGLQISKRLRWVRRQVDKANRVVLAEEAARVDEGDREQ